jgi:uncharacterized damage-inducible protein DinB
LRCGKDTVTATLQKANNATYLRSYDNPNTVARTPVAIWSWHWHVSYHIQQAWWCSGTVGNTFWNVPETDAEKKQNGWSAKEHLGHLYDLEELWWNRWVDFNNGSEVLTPADITNRRTTQANHNSKKIGELLSSFNAERQKILKAIYACDEQLLMRTSLHPRLKTPMTLVDYLYFVAEHDDHHIAAIMLLLNNNANR